MNICEIDVNAVWTGQTAEIGDGEPIPFGWVSLDPPTVPVGKVARAIGGQWVVGDPPAPEVPEQVDMRKAQLQMLDTPWPQDTPTTTLLDALEALVANADRATQIEYAKATTISRHRDLVLGLQAQLGVPDDLMDQLFIAADARP